MWESRTYKNAQMGDIMIKCLKAKTEAIDERRKETQEKFEVRRAQLIFAYPDTLNLTKQDIQQAESLALQEEKELREQLEKQMEALQQEKELREREAEELKQREEKQQRLLSLLGQINALSQFRER